MQMLLKAGFIKPAIVEGAESRRETSKCPDQRQLSTDNVEDETESRFAREFESALGLALRFCEWWSRWREGSLPGYGAHNPCKRDHRFLALYRRRGAVVRGLRKGAQSRNSLLHNQDRPGA